MDIANVRAVSPLCRRGVRRKGAATARTALDCIAARRIGRPVKLVPTRAQGFSIVTFRAETQQRVKLGAAGTDGSPRLARSLGSHVPPISLVVAARLVSRNVMVVLTSLRPVHVVHADRATPGFMRAPESTYMFRRWRARSDELPSHLRMDPVELRRSTTHRYTQ